MMKYKIATVLIITSILYKAQVKPINYNLANIATPEAASLFKYNEYSAPDFIGKKDVTLPIYSIPFGDIVIPININYNTKGNKVADIATSVGLGWHLEAGGAITHIVNDLNDFTDSYSYFPQGGYESDQTYAWHRMSKGYLTPDSDDQLAYMLCGANRIWQSYDDQVDAAPDFYSVNVPEFIDQFFLTKQNGIIKSNFLNFKNAQLIGEINSDRLINCSQFSSDAWGNSGSANVFYKNSTFKLKHENGYTYTFDKSETSSTREYPETFITVNGYQTNTWYLTKIESPYNDKLIIFEYEDYTNNYEHPSLQSLADLQVGGFNVSNDIQIGSSDSNQFSGNILNSVTTTKIYPKRLKKIISSNSVIEFKYLIPRLDYPGEQLNSIIIKDSFGRIIKNVNLSYSYFNSNCAVDYECKRLKLNELNDSLIGVYSFQYDNNIFPPRNSSKIDYLGYFNNNSSNVTFSRTNTNALVNGTFPGTKIYFYPNLLKDNFLPFSLANQQPYAITDGIDKTPNQYSKIGMLEKIIFPTGGSLNISYENDDFLYEGIKYLLGSLRVKEITLKDENNITAKSTSYHYINEDGSSSGQINFVKPPSNIVKSEISSGVSLAKGSVVGYSRIIYKDYNKGKIEKKFSNFNDFPDILMKPDQNISNIAIKNFIKFFKFPTSYVQSSDNRRGVLLEEKIFEEGKVNPSKTIEYHYEYHVNDSLKIQKRFSEYNDTNHQIQQYVASNYLLESFNNMKLSRIVENYNVPLITENHFSYDKKRLIYKKTISSGDMLEEYFRNAKDKSIQKLINANILNINVEVENKKNGKTIRKTQVRYDNPSNIFPSAELFTNIQTNAFETQIIFDKYDSKGNILQYTESNGIPITTIWGYNQTIPLAKIEGATYAQVMEAFNLNPNDVDAYLQLPIIEKSNLDINDSKESELLLELNSFQKSTALKKYIVTTYTHDPLIGVKSITPTSGIRESYKYDDSNRLSKVWNGSDNIIKEYKYNYAPRKFFNDAVDKPFTKNDCPSGMVSSSLNYSVPAAKYMSIISQADANQQAENEGQNYANANLNCYNPYCTLNTQSSASYIMMQYAPFEKGNTTVNAQLHFQVTSSQGLDWSNQVILGNLDSLCWPSSTITKSSGNWQVMIYPASGQTTLRWIGSGGPVVGGYYNVNFSYNLN